MRVWRNTYILYWYYVNVRRRWTGHCICQLHGNVHISRMAPCIHPIYGIGARFRRRLCSVHHERSWVLSRAHKAAFQQPTPKPVFVRFQATSTAVRNVCDTCRACTVPASCLQINWRERTMCFDVFQQFKYMYLSRTEYVKVMAFKHLPINSSDTDTAKCECLCRIIFCGTS